MRAAPPTQRLGAHGSTRAPAARAGRRDARPRAAGGDPPRDRRVAVRRRGPQQDHAPACALRGICTSRKRVLRLTREAGLLAPTPQVRKRAERLHDGRSPPTCPTTLWATDADRGLDPPGRPLRGVRDRRPLHRRGVGRRRAADGPLRRRRPARARSITERFGSVEAGVAAGLALRHDGGTCFRSDHYQAEIDHLGIDRSPAFHYEPETNGVVEKFIQTLKEQVLWIERFDTLEQLRARIRQFAARLQRALAARTPRLPHPTPSPRRAPPARHGMIAAFTNQVSGEPGAASSRTTRNDPPAANP